MERTAEVQLLAEAAGTPVLIEPEMARLTRDQVGSHFAGWFSFQPLFDKIVADQPDLLELTRRSLDRSVKLRPRVSAMDWPLRFGIFMAPFHPVGQNPTLALERDLDLLEHLDGLGFDEAWIGEHHSAGYEIIASPEVFIAAAAQRTKHLRLGTGRELAPLPPAR